MMKYILFEKSLNQYDAGPKARKDASEICRQMGFSVVNIFTRGSGTFERIIQLIKSMIRLVKVLKRGDTVVVQYPYQPYIMDMIYFFIRRKKEINVVLLIHDIFYLWDTKAVAQSNNDFLKKELSVFNRADYLIVHNSKMSEELRSKGVKTPMVLLNVFDYIYDGKLAINTPDKRTIVFAGNLLEEKCGFIYGTLTPQLYSVHLYGNPKPKNSYNNIKYKGSYHPDELISKIEGDYGLVWDGNTIDGCGGVYGNYLKYNNPHKLSMYVAAGLPVIVWKQSAMAEFVENEGIGLCVNSLSELDIMISDISEDVYQAMKVKVLSLSEKLRKGEYLKKALCNVC